MKAAIAVSGLILISTLKVAYADEIDPAPSGNEQTVIDVYPDAQISGPGSNAGSPNSTDGNTIHLDFGDGTQVDNPNPDNTTIIYHPE